MAVIVVASLQAQHSTTLLHLLIALLCVLNKVLTEKAQALDAVENHVRVAMQRKHETINALQSQLEAAEVQVPVPMTTMLCSFIIFNMVSPAILINNEMLSEARQMRQSYDRALRNYKATICRTLYER